MSSFDPTGSHVSNSGDVDVKTLDRLASTTNSGVHKTESVLRLAPQPICLDDIPTFIKNELDRRLYRYDTDFEGMLLHYQDARILTRNETVVLDEYGFPHVKLSLKGHIFRPKKGVEIEASVVEEHTNMIDCRLFDNIYCSVMRCQNKDTVNPGDTIRVVLTDVLHHHRKSKIHARFLSVVSSSSSSQGNINKKITFDDEEEEDATAEDQGGGGGEAGPSTQTSDTPGTEPIFPDHNTNKKQKKKKRKEQDLDNEDDNSPHHSHEEPPSKKKKIKLEIKAETEVSPLRDSNAEENAANISPVKKKKKKKENRGELSASSLLAANG